MSKRAVPTPLILFINDTRADVVKQRKHRTENVITSLIKEKTAQTIIVFSHRIV